MHYRQALARLGGEYNHRGGSITISCAEEGTGQVVIVVSDTGPGLSPADIDRIFVPFERLGAEQTEVEGTGIGLPLARALTEAVRDLPDLILLDLHLPDLHGDQVLSELKAEPATAAIPVVVLSADASRGAIRRLLADGALAYLTKPIELAELGDLLDTFAAARAQHQPWPVTSRPGRPFLASSSRRSPAAAWLRDAGSVSGQSP